MTTIRNQAITSTTSQASNQPATSRSDGAGHADLSASPFAALLQRHVDTDGSGAKAAAQRERDMPRAAQFDQPRANQAAEHTAQREAAREVAHEATQEATHEVAREAEGSASKPAARQAGSKPPAKAADKSAKADGSKAAGNQVDDEESDTKTESTATDPLAAWLAVLNGGAAAPDAASAAANASATTASSARGASRIQGESLLQAADAKEPGLAGELGGTRQTSKADDANGFAALLGGMGRAGDAAGANALGLSAVRMLGSGGDAAAPQTLAQQTALAAEQSGVAGLVGTTAPDASAQAAALSSLTGVGAAPAHGADAPTVAAPVGSPAFAGELADQVQVLVSKAALDAAAGSVHEARLNLNPAEMGPISIRISLDGNQAQVDFAAASGSTRQALQDSMPALASALDGAGLTLSGGGVSQEFSQTRHEMAQQSASQTRSSPLGSVADAAGAVQDLTSTVGSWVRRPEGRLDIYA